MNTISSNVDYNKFIHLIKVKNISTIVMPKYYTPINIPYLNFDLRRTIKYVPINSEMHSQR